MAQFHPQAKVHRRLARQIKVAKAMALAPIDSRPQPRAPPMRRFATASTASAGRPPAVLAAPVGKLPEDED